MLFKVEMENLFRSDLPKAISGRTKKRTCAHIHTTPDIVSYGQETFMNRITDASEICRSYLLISHIDTEI